MGEGTRMTIPAIHQKHFPNSQLAPKRNKYGAKKTLLDGMMFDSMAEAKRWSELALLQKAGEIKNLKRQVVYECVVNGQLVTKYRADFVYDRAGQTVTEDVKGMPRETALFRLKKKLMFACFGIEVEIHRRKR